MALPLILFLNTASLGADEPTGTGNQPTLQFNAFVQTWFSLAENPERDSDSASSVYGFSLPRVRLNPTGSFSKNLSWRLSFSWDRLQANILDAYLDYAFSPSFSLRAGLFPVPGAISGELTPADQLDCIEPAMITQWWNSNTSLRVYRNIGLMMSGSIMQERARYYLMFANSSGEDPFDNQLSQAVYSFPQSGLKFWGRIETRPIDSLDIGAFFSNSLVDHQDTKNTSYGANLFFKLENLFVKMEYIAGEYGLTDQLTEWRGFWLSASYHIERFSPVFRYDSYTPVVGKTDKYKVNRYDHITLGLSYQASDALRFQANIVFRNESDLDGDPLNLRNNIFILNLQYSFGAKIL